LSIVEDRAGYLWFGTSGGGLNRFDRRTGRFKAYRHNTSDFGSLSDDIVYCLFVDRRGDLWAGTSDGLNRYDPSSDRFHVYKVDGVGMSSYRTISQDSAGNLWLSTVVAGVHRFNEDSGQFSTYRHTEAPGSLSNDWVNAVCVDHSGIVWAGTLSGLNRLDPATGVFRTFYESDGLPNDNVASIVDDLSGDLWLGTNKGLSRFSPRTNKFRNYYASDGIAGNELYRRNGAFRSSSGEVFFSSTFGLTSFFPDQVVDNSYIPPVVLTDFLLSGKAVSIGGNSPLSQSISLTKSLTLQPEQSIFSFEFSALSYENPERNRYRYRLEGLENNWNEKDSYHRTVIYTTLPAGAYTFRVQGSNDRGLWNELGASVRVLVLPPWWKTWWFGSGCVLISLLLVWYAHRFRLSQIARQLNLRFEERLAERTRIAQELHDTLLQGIAGASMHLHVAAEHVPGGSPLTEPLRRALDTLGSVVREGRNAVQGLRLQHRDDTELDEAFSNMGLDLATRDQPEYRVAVEGHPMPLHPVVRDEVYRIGREAVVNAFRHSAATEIRVEIRYSRDCLCLLIRDDGCGIDPRILNSGRPGHWGLLGMRERAERIEAQFVVKSGAARGTEIRLTVPGRTAFSSGSDNGRTRWFRRQTLRGEGSKGRTAVRVSPGERD
jgi:signal transduction histidine kinase/streptogramin lyase